MTVHTMNPNKQLIVTPVASNKKPGQVVAFIGKQLCFFESGDPMPVPNVPVSVMISRPVYRKCAPPREAYFDFENVMALVLRVVTEDHLLVKHDGFERSGSMCCETSSGILFSGRRISLTPGRTGVFILDNMGTVYDNSVNRTYGDGLKQKPLGEARPGYAYISNKILLEKRSMIRIEGLLDVEDGEYAPYIKS